ncbi:DUF6344 domain-containing protein [Streptomyces sp. NPDC094448]|uniref:DUF6344 domain-containing protein n=1 Tax=Streptomyces sp. NPDC094448 TaxID=3366063 RepID=UPI00382E1CEF
MTAQKVRDMGNAVLAALVALLAALGFARPAAARLQSAGAPVEPVLPTLGADSPAGATAATEGAAPDQADQPDPVRPDPAGSPGAGQRDRTRSLRPERVRELVRERERERGGAVRSLLSMLIPSQTQRWHAGPREKSLPPTIKQRIGAEAHGSSPSVRRIPLFDTDTPDAAPEPESAGRASAVDGSSGRGAGAGTRASGRTADRTAVPAARSSFTTAA